MAYKYKFTVFTPCFNSERFIHRVYESLKKQTFRDFEWLVINDASTDNTHNILEKYIAEADFPIRYFNLTENQMLTRNYNLAIREAQGELFLPAGHDDAFVPDALQIFTNNWDKYANENLAGISCLCIDQNGRLIGDKYPESPLLSNYIDMVYHRKIKGEKWGFMRTDVIKKYILPENIDVYVSEALMWMGIAADYSTIYINETLRIYYTNQPGHTSLAFVNTYKIKYPNGIRYYNLQMIKKYQHLIRQNKLLKIQFYINYIRMSLIAKKSLLKTIGELTSIKDQLIALIIFPFAVLRFYRDKIKRRI